MWSVEENEILCKTIPYFCQMWAEILKSRFGVNNVRINVYWETRPKADVKLEIFIENNLNRYDLFVNCECNSIISTIEALNQAISSKFR